LETFEHAVQQVHFAVVRNGYDRRQVDEDIAEAERRAAEARTRIEEAEANLAEVTQRARALEAKISVLRTRSPRRQAPGVAPVTELADRLLDTVNATSRELPSQIVSEAERDKAQIERMTSDVREGARFRAARIVGSARRDQEQADLLVSEARKQVDEYIGEGRSTAEARAQAVWNEARVRLRQPMTEVDDARRRSRTMRRELRQLQDLRDEYWERVAGRADRQPRGPVDDTPVA
jgi:chromosome segregation ATPase